MPSLHGLPYLSVAPCLDVHIGFLEQGFHFDNESPAHQSHTPAFKMANRLITNAEYLEFICDGGYKRPEIFGSWVAVKATTSYFGLSLKKTLKLWNSWVTNPWLN